MPFDGILVKSISQELDSTLSGGRIGKIYQVGRDAIIVPIRANSENYGLLLSCNANAARIHITDRKYDTPDSPPVFCMLLRKHLSGGIIKAFITDGFERIITIVVDASDELGDRSLKKLIIEIMGRHSNIILLNKNGIIIDAIKHVGFEVNRIRELLPARTYILPPAQDKLDPTADETLETLLKDAESCGRKVESFLLDRLQGFSPVLCREVCFRADIEDSKPASELSHTELMRLITAIKDLMGELQKEGQHPVIVFDSDMDKAIDFHCVNLTQYQTVKSYDTISSTVETFFTMKNRKEFNHQRANDLQKIVMKQVEKCEKRLAINIQTYEENKKYDDLKVLGELITANIYALSKGMETAKVVNYYSETGEIVEIPLNKNKSPQQNAQAYFKKYNKSRAAYLYSEKEIEVLKTEIAYLDSVVFTIENSEGEQQTEEIRQELHEQGYLKASEKKSKKVGKNKKNQPVQVLPLKLVSKDGFEILVGRNNKENDKLTLKTARHEDIWFHIKNFPGSHVVIKTEGKTVPDSTMLEAAQYAAWFSKARSAPKVEVDYTAIRNVKKPAGAKPGMVIYVNYSTISVTPTEPD